MDVPEKIDYVVVLDKDPQDSMAIDQFVNFLRSRGLSIQIIRGQIKQNFYYIVIRLSAQAARHLAQIYSINRHQNDIRISEIDRKPTTMEKILIIHEVLKETNGLDRLTRLGLVKAAYPLHDGDCRYYQDQDHLLNDRQLLLKHWANFSVWYKAQPLDLIAKYYGTEVAFYFAWLGFYNKMLVLPALVGLVCFLVSTLHLFVMHHHRANDICSSQLVMCPVCFTSTRCHAEPLSESCLSANVSVIFDNYTTVFFAVFMSFWATVFLNMWTRLENVLKLRWNVEYDEDDSRIRLEYRERATRTRYSVVTGEPEPYISFSKRFSALVLTYGTCCLLLIVVATGVFTVALYRIATRGLLTTRFVSGRSTFIVLSTSNILQVIFIKIFGKFYSELSEWLTHLENPRTQTEFDNSVVNKRYMLGFANNYASLFYIAFLKGRFYDPSRSNTYRSDVCEATGCLMHLCVQLFFLMVLKSLLGNILTLVVPKIMQLFKKVVSRTVKGPQWEKEYELVPSGRYSLTTEFMEMIVQYGFVTFFVAAFPLAPLFALINNCMELRLDAYKLVTRYRRPVPKQQSGIGPWRGILQSITRFSVATNAFVLAFTSDFVVREIYKRNHSNTLKGYIRSTLSVFDLKDSTEGLNSTLCYYRGWRYPPDHPMKYQLTVHYWYEVGVRLVCVIVFEHLIWVANGILSYLIPDVPKAVKEKLHQNRNLERDLKFKARIVDATGTKNRKSKIRISRIDVVNEGV